ncbi:hypothetical protein J3F84DRAFT_375683 [Trichoderma pleuroticola]
MMYDVGTHGRYQAEASYLLGTPIQLRIQTRRWTLLQAQTRICPPCSSRTGDPMGRPCWHVSTRYIVGSMEHVTEHIWPSWGSADHSKGTLNGLGPHLVVRVSPDESCLSYLYR